MNIQTGNVYKYWDTHLIIKCRMPYGTWCGYIRKNYKIVTDIWLPESVVLALKLVGKNYHEK